MTYSYNDIIINAIGYIVTWALVEFVGWWTAIILLVALQIISWRLGAGFIMVSYRAIKACLCPDDEEEENNNNGTNIEDERTESMALNAGGNDQPQSYDT